MSDEPTDAERRRMAEQEEWLAVLAAPPTTFDDLTDAEKAGPVGNPDAGMIDPDPDPELERAFAAVDAEEQWEAQRRRPDAHVTIPPPGEESDEDHESRVWLLRRGLWSEDDLDPGGESPA